ncbi:hypothetical protein chiPu_0016863 [Chiloscyllium punctatum]|uniref:Solute carrier family 25 member 16 n=1 Tax=Chiloscyllium punctatum TaxID=137246 RepID=A0A401T6S5_CHIPU|nr:hypothetical protein [Chiloscyllium punctatum]
MMGLGVRWVVQGGVELRELQEDQTSFKPPVVMTTEASIPASAKTGVGAPTRRDFFWLRSLVAGGVFSTLRAVPKKEGFLGLYKGNGAMMVRIFPYGAIQFTAFDRYRKLLIAKLGISGHIHRLMAGSMAGMTAVICTYPLDMIRARLAFQVKGEHRYAGIIDAFRVIYTQKLQKLCDIRFSVAQRISFFTFGTLKSIGLSQAPGILGRPSSDNPNVLVLKTHVNLLCGGIAGAFAQTVSYPLDVARRRMQLGSILTEADKCVSMCKTLKYVYKVHGIQKGLYRGLTLNYIRCIPSQAVAFTTYELMRQVLHLN